MNLLLMKRNFDTELGSKKIPLFEGVFGARQRWVMNGGGAKTIKKLTFKKIITHKNVNFLVFARSLSLTLLSKFVFLVGK